jgi:hypothetical protein
MTLRDHKGQFVSTKNAMIVDLEGFIADWKRWALAAFRKDDREDGARCMAELNDCRQKLKALTA